MNETTILRAAAAQDAAGVQHRPACVAARRGRIVAVGLEDEMPCTVGEASHVIDLPQTLILPALVNAHSHLDLTALGPMAYNGDFVSWLHMVMVGRQQLEKANRVAESVRNGADLSIKAGVGHVGDVANTAEAVITLHEVGQSGISFIETFGMGRMQQQGNSRLDAQIDQLHARHDLVDNSNLKLGISPHAPYSAGPKVYEYATRLSRQWAYRLCTHLAESPQEVEFLQHGTGMFTNLLKAAERWDETIKSPAKHPVDYLEPYLRKGRYLVAHCNYLDHKHIQILRQTDTSVVYCPIASDYFGHRNHRYREMLAAGVNVCLGTDSILCQPADERQPLGILPQMRYLFRRDGTEPRLLLKMATINGIRALELEQLATTLQSGTRANLIGVPFDAADPTDPLTQVLENDYPVQPLNLTEMKT